MLLQFWSAASCYADRTIDAKLKAAYILNFARFVYWPEEAFRKSGQVINLCLYKNCPEEQSLKSLSNRTIQNKKISVKVIDSEEGLEDCHVVFFSNMNEEENKTVKSRLKNRMVLTVSDVPGFIETDGLIEFMNVDGKIKFKINISRSRDNGIKYKTQLLEVAEIVR